MNNLREPAPMEGILLAGLQHIEAKKVHADPDTLEAIMATAERIIRRQRQEQNQWK